MAGTRVPTIQEFMLRYVVGADPAGEDDADRDALRAEIERHNDRTMTVVTLSGTTTITRCGVCPKQETRPCLALRVMALPYARHPAYRQEWRVPQPEDLDHDAQEDSPAATHGDIPRPREEPGALDPPAVAGRAILRQGAD